MSKNTDVLKQALPVLQEALKAVVSRSPDSEIKKAGESQLLKIKHYQERFDELTDNIEVSDDAAYAVHHNAERVRHALDADDYQSALEHSSLTIKALPDFKSLPGNFEFSPLPGNPEFSPFPSPENSDSHSPKKRR